MSRPAQEGSTEQETKNKKNRRERGGRPRMRTVVLVTDEQQALQIGSVFFGEDVSRKVDIQFVVQTAHLVNRNEKKNKNKAT
jgi:hypothetical protein